MHKAYIFLAMKLYLYIMLPRYIDSIDCTLLITQSFTQDQV